MKNVTPEQLEHVMTTIAEQCKTINELLVSAITEGVEGNAEHLVIAARQLALATGMIADRFCKFQMLGGIDEWMLPPAYHRPEGIAPEQPAQ